MEQNIRENYKLLILKIVKIEKFEEILINLKKFERICKKFWWKF